RSLELDGVIDHDTLKNLRRGCERAPEFLLVRGERVFGNANVGANPTATVHGAARIGAELWPTHRIGAERIWVDLDIPPVDVAPFAVNGAPARRMPLAGGQLQVVAALQRVERLHQSLAVARRADDERAVMILQRAGNDLGSRRRTTVYQDDERQVGSEVFSARLRDLVREVASAHAHDVLSLAQKQTRDRKRLVDDAAGISAHVEHDAFGPFFHEGAHRLLDFVRGVLVERLEGDVADLAADDAAERDGGDVHHATHEAKLDGLGDAGSGVRDDHRRAGLA